MVELRVFEPDPAYILAKVAQSAAPKPVVDFSIDPDDIMTPPADEYFICQMCTSIVRNPQQCG